MSVYPHGYPVYAWNPWVDPSITHVTLGQDRYVEHADPEPPRRPVGFAPPKTVVDPMVWEGDNA